VYAVFIMVCSEIDMYHKRDLNQGDCAVYRNPFLEIVSSGEKVGVGRKSGPSHKMQ
jgi:hypothetical protein